MRFVYPEGATPIGDISDLKPVWVKTQEDLNQVEAENIANAMDKYVIKPVPSQHDWFTVAFLQKIHREMFGEVWGWAGYFRKTGTISGVAPYRIRSDLESLCGEVSFWEKEGAELTILERAARVHHQLVWIHPFPNGNGRFARLITDRYLKTWKSPILRWPRDLGNDGIHRKRYIGALKSGDGGDLAPLIAFMGDFGARDPSLGALSNNGLAKGICLELLEKALQRRESKTFA